MEGARPLIDLSKLTTEKEVKHKEQNHGQEQGQDSKAKAQGPQYGWKPAGLLARNKCIAAMALVRHLRVSPALEAEQKSSEVWWSGLLGRGLFFEYSKPGYNYKVVFMSLGFFGHAALCWRLNPEFVNGHGRKYIQLSHVPIRATYNSDDRDRLLGHGPLWWMFGHEVQQVEHLKGINAKLVVPGMCPQTESLQNCGLVWEVGELEDFLPFVIRNRVSISTDQLTMLAKVLGIPLGSRITGKTSSQELGAMLCRTIAVKLLPDVHEEDLAAMVRAIVEPRLADLGLPDNYDPTLVGALDVLKEGTATRKGQELDQYRQAAMGQAEQPQAPKAVDGRAGRAIVLADRRTPVEYRAATLVQHVNANPRKQTGHCGFAD